jgi:hypothetical protein
VTGEAAAPLVVTLWCAGTLGHFLLIDLWGRRFGWAGTTRDTRFFATMLAGTASLGAALHLVASTTGLAIGPVLAVLAAGHLLAWRRAPDRPPAGGPVESGDAVTRALEAVAVVVLSAIAIQWALVAAPTLAVSGTDAAHYHIPNAVNLALGASPFDLPPSSHLYPMGGSMLAAWFILPTGDARFTDLPMLLPFLLLVAALGWLFRLSTGLSGLAWMTWPTLLLFGTRLFRSASLMSADLLFTAAVAAVAALAYGAIVERRVTGSWAILTALSAGLLLGAKTTGVVALLLFGGPATAVLLALFWRGSLQVEIRRPPLVLVATAAAIVAGGGIWLIRNWWVWGSPVVPNGLTLFGIEIFRGVPYEPTTYLSVLGDMANDPAYDPLERLVHHVREWLSPWYLPALAAIALIPIDAGVSLIGGRGLGAVARRAGLLALAAGTMIPMLWLLAGAPWTSLEWTRGMSLRYAQPWWALLPLVAAAALFPSSAPWYRRPMLAGTAGIVLAAMGLRALATNGGIPFPPAPSLFVALAAGAVWYGLRVAGRRAGWWLAAAVLVVSAAAGGWTAGLDAAARAAAGAAPPPADPTPVQRIYAAARQSEPDRGLACSSRRFFVTTRLDEPLHLQDVAYTNFVFYAAREVAVTTTVEPMRACDYLITSRDVLTTPKGMALVAALNPFGATVELAEAGPFVLLARR